VLAVGRPGRKITASFGIVSAIADDWRGAAGGRIDRVLRLDLSIYDGFSGGPLVDSNGALIGIDNSALARGTPTALPASTVDRVVDELLERGHIRRPFIGVAVQQVALNAATVARHKLSRDGGLVVVSIADGSPAESAGILIGDVLLSAGGQPVRRPTDLLDALSTVADGASLELEHLRGSTIAQSKVTPIDRGARGASEGGDR
jgi:S1-C subfamily serine protease